MKNGNFLLHLALAAFVAFGVSLGAWAVFDIYNPVGFWVASLASTLIAAATGWLSGRFLLTTLAVVILLRGAILFLALAG